MKHGKPRGRAARPAARRGRGTETEATGADPPIGGELVRLLPVIEQVINALSAMQRSVSRLNEQPPETHLSPTSAAAPSLAAQSLAAPSLAAPPPPAPSNTDADPNADPRKEDDARQADDAREENARMTAAIAALTPRLRGVFQRIGEGQSNKDIARAEHRSVRTIETYRYLIRTQLGLKDPTTLAQLAWRFMHRVATGRVGLCCG